MEVIAESIELDPRIPAPVFKFVEWKLYHYPENKLALERYESSRQDILYRGRQVEPGGMFGGGGISSPVERKTVQIIIMEDRLSRERIWVEAIDEVMAVLTEEEKRLIKLKYFDGYLTNAGVARELKMGEVTYYRRRESIVRKLAIRFGLI